MEKENINKQDSVLIVVPNKDGKKHLTYSLLSISKIVRLNLSVVVVDNCSNDDSIDYVYQEYPSFKVIKNAKDLGFSGSVNTGIKYGLSIDAKYIVIFSNDVIMHPQCIDRSVQYLQGEKSSIILGYSEINGHYLDEMLLIPTKVTSKEQIRPDCVSVYMFKSDLIRSVGFFDEMYYMYGEDDDFFYRCSQAGFKVKQTNIPIWHKGDGYSDSIEKQRSMSQYVYRNMLRMAVKNYSFLKISNVVIKMIIFAFTPNIFWKSIGNSKSRDRLIRFNLYFRIKFLLYSVFWNVKNFKETKHARYKESEWIKSNRKKVNL
jgi:GT2 family glycosyltransferase